MVSSEPICKIESIFVNASVSVLICSFFAIVLLAFSEATAIPLFWTDHIDSAINHRDDYFNSITAPYDSIAIQSWNYERKLETLETLDNTPSLDNAWYHITRGLIDGSLSDTNQAVFFNRALYLAQSDPGTIWLLFNEFEKNKQHNWANRSLEQLEKMMLQSGAYKSRTIFEQLLFIAQSYEKDEKQQALRIYHWAEKFDFSQSTSSKKIAIMAFPFDIKSIFTEYGNFLTKLKGSWVLQLQLASDVYNWSRWIFIFFVATTILVLTIKYAPYALHRISDILPYTVPLYLRSPLITSLFFTFATFGFVFFLWVSSIIIWKFLSKKEKTLILFALSILVISPIDCYIRAAFITAANPHGVLQNFSRSINEGYSEDQYRHLFEKPVDTTDYLTHLSAAVYNLKRSDFASATTCLRNANSISGSDPVILTVAGNLHFLKKDIDKAEEYYRQAIKNDKKNAEALFNLAQCQLRRMQTISAAEYISDAAHIKPDFVNNFIHSNEKYFSRNWPQIRHIMFSDLTPKAFWAKHFPHYALNWQTASILWKPNFFALPPVISMILFIIIFIFLAFYKTDKDQRTIKKLFECRFCGMVICRKCKSGTLCHSCNEATQFMSNEKSLEKMQKLISYRAKEISLLKTTLVDIFFPGAGKLLNQNFSISKILPLIVLTSIVYASYVSFFTSLATSHSIYSTFIIVLLITYNIYFLLKHITLTIRVLKGLSNQ